MRDYLSLGPTPVEEDCVQVGKPDYSTVAREECEKFVELLKKKFPRYQEFGCTFKVKSNPHDFGEYYNVVVNYYVDDKMSAEYALFVEHNTPLTWNDDKEMEFVEEEGEEKGEDEWFD